MNKEHTEIYELIAKSFSGELTEEDTLLLNRWKTAEASNLREYEDIKIIWARSERLVIPSPIDFQKSLGLTRKKAGIDSKKFNWPLFFIQIAAVLVLALLFSSVYNALLVPDHKNKSASLVYQEVKASYGTQSRVELADGTIVYLNSGSTLRFPNSFDNMKTRRVELTGEGFFTVAKNNEHPFIVDLHRIQIKVLGTSFNAEAYPENPTITIALVEGSIQLQQRNSEDINDLLKMKPNNVAIYKQTENILQWKTEDDLNKYTAWREGKIVFSNDPVNTVIQKLEHWYNVDIELSEPVIKKYRFTGTFIDEPLEQVLTILNMTSKMSYSIIPAEKRDDNSYTKRRIILKSK